MRSLTALGATLALYLGLGAAHATVFTVTSTADTAGATCGSPCTLRQAIQAANANTGADVINFSVSGTIALGSVLPTVTDTLMIDGTGRSVVLSGGGAVQVLQLNSATTLNLISLTIADGRASAYATAGAVTVLPPSAATSTGGAALNLSRCVLSGNTSTGPFAAGAIVLSTGNGTLTVANSSFTGNAGQLLTGEPSVGVIFSASSGSITIADSSFENNAGSTGAIHSGQGLLTISGSTFAGNSANTSGGAIWASQSGTIANSTFFGNSATHRGGAIFFARAADIASQLTVTHSTFAGNASNAGNLAGLNGAIYSAPNTVLRNTIVANSSNGNCSANVVDGGGNLSDDASCAITAATSLANTPAQLGSLQGNGGPTRTMAPLAGSPAVDQGVNQLAIDASLSTDQRGTAFPRISPAGGTVDRGAVEIQVDNTPPTCTASARPNRLLKANHKLVDITTTVAAVDNLPGVAFKLRSVTSSEADSKLGRDDVPLDIQGWAVGTADLGGQLRDERYSRAGRIYTIAYEVRDAAGNISTCSATVTAVGTL